MNNRCVCVCLCPEDLKLRQEEKFKTIPSNKAKNPHPRTVAQACYSTALGVIAGTKWNTQRHEE